MRPPCPSLSQSLLKLMFIDLVMPSNYLILCFPLLLQPSIFPSIRVLSNQSDLCVRWPNYWSFSFNLSLSNEYSPCSPRGSQESYSVPQFKSINSSALSFIYGPTLKKAEHRRIDAFKLWCWRRLLRAPWTARRSN